jgi:hypothetical protein
MAVLPLCVGAAMPDVVDGIDGMIRHGSFGQGYAHTLLGAVCLCVPLGMLATWLIVLLDRWVLRRSRLLSPVRRFLVVAGRWEVSIGNSPRHPAPVRWVLSLAVGAVSHVLFDCISHERCRLFYPFREGGRCFPGWWYDRWFSIPLPGYAEPYPFGPHTLIWCVLTIVGAVLYFVRPRNDSAVDVRALDGNRAMDRGTAPPTMAAEFGERPTDETRSPLP